MSLPAVKEGQGLVLGHLLAPESRPPLSKGRIIRETIPSRFPKARKHVLDTGGGTARSPLSPVHHRCLRNLGRSKQKIQAKVSFLIHTHACPRRAGAARGPQRRLSAGAPGAAGRTMRPFTPGGSGGAWRPPWGARAAPGPALHGSWFGSSGNRSLQPPSGKYSDATPTFVLLLPPGGGKARSLCLSTLSQGGGPRTPIKWWPRGRQDGEHGERAESPLPLDTFPGSPAAGQARRETVAPKNNPSSV